MRLWDHPLSKNDFRQCLRIATGATLGFTSRVLDEWNRLSSHVVSANTTDSFKRRLDKFIDGDKNC